MKNILIIAPTFYGYRNAIVDELKLSGWSVSTYDERPSNSTFTKILLRLGYDFVLKNKIKEYYSSIIDDLKRNKYSYVLFINIESVTADILVYMKKVSPNTIFTLYMWDSSINKPKYPELVKYFDKAYTFDELDSACIPDIKFLPLFYIKSFDCKNQIRDVKYDLSFVGAGHSDRSRILSRILTKSIDEKINCFFKVYFPSRLFFLLQMIKYSRSIYILKKYMTFVPSSFKEVSTIMKASKVVLDLSHRDQNGLTMRTIESVGLNQKLITTNKNIINYNFYKKDMIHILDREDIKLPNAVFFENHAQFEEGIRQEYSLCNWLKKILS